MKYCQNCGALLEENAKFCQGCGTPVGGTRPVPRGAAEAEANGPDAKSSAPDTVAASSSAKSENAGNGPGTRDEGKQDFKRSLKKGREVEVAGFKRKPLWYIFGCIVVLVILVVILVQCSGTSKRQILETAKTFTLDSSDVTLGEAAETNLSNVEWTCYKVDDGYWTVTVSGYNPNEDATATLLIEVSEIDDEKVYYKPIYGEVNGTGSGEAADINYAIAIVYDNVGQALVDSLTSYLLGI